jgi:Fuc2NAc and GlcNAc transferase
MPAELILGLACFVLSALMTQAVRRLALTHGLLDIPNERSSHAEPTPRGGGIAVVTTATACFVLLGLAHRLDLALTAALAGGLGVAAVGFMDDRRPLPVAVRLIAHLAAALWALAWLGGLPSLRVGDQLITWGPAGYLLGALGIVWAINLFNFMDGIDGVAASEAIFITVAGALLTPLLAGSAGDAWAAVLVAAACGGFLLWNWPPARVFLGDAGSGYLGYVIAVLAVGATRKDPVALWVWLILGGVFFVDATVTLLRRFLHRERLQQAHRSHAYQWLARRWGSHRRVTLAVLAVNIVWLLPWAVLAAKFPSRATLSVVAALAPLAVVLAVLGAGRREHSSEGQ